MSDKAQSYAHLAEKTAESLTKSLANWTGFLATVGRLYKYPYHEQLMIHAQRPNAVACADYELWNNKMNRYVRRGSKGIALLDDTGDRLRLKYVFDVSDTGGREKSRYPFLWEMQEYHKDPILEMLKDKYDNEDISISDALYNIAKDLAAEYYEDHKADIEYLTEGSFLEDYDEDNIRVAFEDAATVSIAYTLMKRCGLDTEEYFDHEDFLNIFDFNTADAVAMLGTAVSEQSEQVLRQIALTIAKIERERSKSHERTHLQQERGLSDTRPHTDRADGQQGTALGQIRQNEEKIPTGTQNTVISFPAPVGEVVSTSTGNRPDSQQEIGADNGRLAESADTARQEEKSDGLGGTHEQSESSSGGNDTDRAHIQLSLFPTEEEQKQRIAENEGLDKPFRTSAFSLQQEETEHELKNGTGTVGGKFRVHQFYQSMPTEKAAIDFIKQEYGYYGHSHTFTDGTAGFVDYQPSLGMKITRYSNPESQTILKWLDVEKYLRSLVFSDRYLSEQEKEKAGITEQPFVPSSTVEPIASVPDHEPQTKTEAAPQEQEKAENFRITDDILGEGSKREKFARNIAAITTLQTIEREHRTATNEEQEILSQYIGWGGLSEAFDKDNSSFSSEYTQLKSLLSEEEYSMARASTLNAHYTTPLVIRSIYEAVEKMGFETGNILDIIIQKLIQFNYPKRCYG